jgi:hypothetical protein
MADMHVAAIRICLPRARGARGGDPSKMLLQRAGDGWLYVAGDAVTLPE